MVLEDPLTPVFECRTLVDHRECGQKPMSHALYLLFCFDFFYIYLSIATTTAKELAMLADQERHTRGTAKRERERFQSCNSNPSDLRHQTTPCPTCTGMSVPGTAQFSSVEKEESPFLPGRVHVPHGEHPRASLPTTMHNNSRQQNVNQGPEKCPTL
jgi:hypothetical protein